MATCSVEGCDNTVYCRGWCRLHYARWRKHGDPLFVLRNRNTYAKETVCSVEGCERTVRASGFCDKHYYRWKTNGDPLVAQAHAENGAPQEFIEMALNHQDKEACLYWPFARNQDGYAVHTYTDKRSQYVSRVICEIIHGPPPTPKHQACHNCGKGHLGCVNPYHLRWDTNTGNMADAIIHGTIASGERSGVAKLTREKAREIKALKGKLSGLEVATMYGVGQTAIYSIWSDTTWKE